MTNNEFFLALEMMEKEKGIPAEYLAEKIAGAITVAAKHDYGGNDIVFCDIDCGERTFDVYVRKLVADEVTDPNTEISVADAAQYDKSAQAGDYVQIPLDTMKYGRIKGSSSSGWPRRWMFQ